MGAEKCAQMQNTHLCTNSISAVFPVTISKLRPQARGRSCRCWNGCMPGCSENSHCSKSSLPLSVTAICTAGWFGFSDAEVKFLVGHLEIRQERKYLHFYGFVPGTASSEPMLTLYSFVVFAVLFSTASFTAFHFASLLLKQQPSARPWAYSALLLEPPCSPARRDVRQAAAAFHPSFCMLRRIRLRPLQPTVKSSSSLKMSSLN